MVDETPRAAVPVDNVEHLWIPMTDGVRLSARLWRPVVPHPVPALLEYIPYRKRDLVRARDSRNHPWLAGQGYACLRVDMRGSGDSEGHMPDMYAAAELSDALEVIHWIAEQDWCDGQVGMFGTSWGGTASLQAACAGSAPLKAVLANCATANRFDDDIHWMGGCLLTDSFEWGATLPAILACPPDAAIVGEGWNAQWQERLQQLTCPLQAWISNDVRGRYWRHGSALFQPEDLSCPVLSVGGWADRYANSVMPLVAARPDLCWGIVGPWGHHYPDQGVPGPGMSFQQVALRWWDHWMRGGPAPDWPQLQLWQREFEVPQDRIETRAGAWRAITDPARTDETVLYLGRDGLTDQASEATCLPVPNDLRHGEASGDTGYFGRDGGLPLDQAPDDARTLCFDTAPLDAPLDLVGHAQVQVQITRDVAEAQLVCRICDVAPDGTSLLVTRHILNLALDATLDAPSAFVPDAPVTVTLRLPSIAYRFAKGHRVRLAFGTSYWPLVWPTARPATLLLGTGAASLSLPCPVQMSSMVSELPAPVALPENPDWVSHSAGPLHRSLAASTGSDIVSGWHQPLGSTQYPQIGVTISSETSMQYVLHDAGASGQGCVFDTRLIIERADGRAEIHSALSAQAGSGGLRADLSLTARWNGNVVAQRDWKIDAPS